MFTKHILLAFLGTVVPTALAGGQMIVAWDKSVNIHADNVPVDLLPGQFVITDDKHAEFSFDIPGGARTTVVPMNPRISAWSRRGHCHTVGSNDGNTLFGFTRVGNKIGLNPCGRPDGQGKRGLVCEPRVECLN